jgi:hypothetical protein
LEEAIKNSKNRKSAGLDSIPMQLWKYSGKKMKKLLLHFFNNLWKQGIVPKEWETALMINIYKKEAGKICNNYRRISLLSTVSKIYVQILKMKVNTTAEGFLNESLNGFRRGRSCTDAIFSLQQILEKRREFNLPTYLLFLDYKKTYDSINRSKLWSILESYDVQQNLINAIKCLYKNTEICIKISDTKISKPVTVNAGLCQGCGLPPVLFNIYINKIIELWKITNPKGIKITRDTQITHLVYADDQVLLAFTEDGLQRAVTGLNHILQLYNLQILETKTKAMGIQGKYWRRVKVVINNKIIEQVSSFTYLGSKISDKIIADLEI